MSKIVIIGITGYSGGNIAAEAVARGHQVIGVSRNAPTAPLSGVEFRVGSMEDWALLAELFADADVVISAVRSSRDGMPFLVTLIPELLRLADEHSTRLGVVGGSGSLSAVPGGPRLIDAPDFDLRYKAEAASHGAVLDALRAAETGADWFYVSPSAMYGAHMPGERTGSYRVGGDALLFDEAGKSAIGGEDFAIAFLDEVEKPAHRKARFTVGH